MLRTLLREKQPELFLKYGRRCIATVTTEQLLSDENKERFLTCIQKPMDYRRQKRLEESHHPYAAVLIAICLDTQGEPSILYTRRSAMLRRHYRQISFPGGKRDDSDTDYVDCALRETEEEIGLPRSRVKVWGTGSLFRPPNTAAIMPVIGEVRDFNLSELELNEHEVEEAFTLPLAKLTDPSSLHYTQFKSGYSAPMFIVDGYRVWGVTGFLTFTFLNCLLPAHLNRLKGRVKYLKSYKPTHRKGPSTD